MIQHSNLSKKNNDFKISKTVKPLNLDFTIHSNQILLILNTNIMKHYKNLLLKSNLWLKFNYKVKI